MKKYKYLERPLPRHIVKQIRADAIDECIREIIMMYPSEPFLFRNQHHKKWLEETKELRMLKRKLEQLK